jgi:hypothetical protein
MQGAVINREVAIGFSFKESLAGHSFHMMEETMPFHWDRFIKNASSKMDLQLLQVSLAIK